MPATRVEREEDHVNEGTAGNAAVGGGDPIGAPILALIFRWWGVGAMVFGLGAIVLGIRQIRLGERRSERVIGIGLLLGGAFTMVDGVARLLFGA